MTSRTGSVSGEEAREQLYELMRNDPPLDELMGRVLDIGTRYLGVDHGHITRIDTEAGVWEAIASTDPPDGPYPAGLTFDLSKSYCRRTIAQPRPIALHDAPAQGWADDVAFAENGLHCYHGARFVVAGEPYGTACFVSKDPRAEPFSEAERTFTELLGQVLGQAVERDRYESELERRELRLEQRERLNRVLNRVLRHNLRNDMNIVQGYADLIRPALEGEQTNWTDRIHHITERLLDLAETARQLEAYTTASEDGAPSVAPIDLVGLVERAAEGVRSSYPEAAISVEAPPEATALAAPRVEPAVEELLENAAKHTGEAPTIAVTVERVEGAVRVHVDDDGPGLPESERHLLRHGEETPVKHGQGLGIWLVYWLVTSAGGEVSARVTETGTTVSLRFPVPAGRFSSSTTSE